MRSIYEGYLKYADQKLSCGPNARAMLYKAIAGLGLSAFEAKARVVWTTGYSIPMVLYQPFNLVPFDFEYAAVDLVARGGAAQSLAASNRLGYPVDTCSAHRVALGAQALGLFPPADLLISTTHFCDGKPKCNEIFKEEYHVPFYLVDVPLEKDERALDYVESQLRHVFSALCRLTGREENESVLVEPIRNYNRVLSLMMEINRLRCQKPAPYLPANRGLTMSMLGSRLLGRPELISIYEQFLRELRRAPREDGPDGGERVRLLWLLASPVYPTNIFDTLSEFGARIVAEEFTFELMHPLSEEKPLRSIAEWILDSRFIRPVEERINNILKWVDDYQVDGVVSFTHLPCRQGNGALSLIKQALNEKGVVLMNLEGDICDPTMFSPTRMRREIENYVQILLDRGRMVH
jgi:benzoyl-CoA reductase/2-hydroxyglutaryl-CoA dehydratase subunit BcrC/BadD/HgdB